jgi:hypothetical protein
MTKSDFPENPNGYRSGNVRLRIVGDDIRQSNLRRHFLSASYFRVLPTLLAVTQQCNIIIQSAMRLIYFHTKGMWLSIKDCRSRSFRRNLPVCISVDSGDLEAITFGFLGSHSSPVRLSSRTGFFSDMMQNIDRTDARFEIYKIAPRRSCRYSPSSKPIRSSPKGAASSRSEKTGLASK